MVGSALVVALGRYRRCCLTVYLTGDLMVTHVVKQKRFR